MSELRYVICESGWHDQGHSSHSTCPSCGGQGMRATLEREARERQAYFERKAAEWALENGWTPPYIRPAEDPHTLVAKALDGSL